MNWILMIKGVALAGAITAALNSHHAEMHYHKRTEAIVWFLLTIVQVIAFVWID